MTPSLEHNEETTGETCFPSHVSVYGNPERASLQREGSQEPEKLKLAEESMLASVGCLPGVRIPDKSRVGKPCCFRAQGAPAWEERGPLAAMCPPETRKLASAAHVTALASHLPGADSESALESDSRTAARFRTWAVNQSTRKASTEKHPAENTTVCFTEQQN